MIFWQSARTTKQARPAVALPTARAEGRVTINRILDQTSNIAISEAAHGPADARRYTYLPTYFLRGLARLELELTPA